MVFESIVKSGDHPAFVRLLAFGFVAPFASGITSYILFKPWAGIAALFLCMILLIPALYSILTTEEKITEHIDTESAFIGEYGHVLVGLMGMFIGLTAGYFLMFVSLSGDIQSLLFSVQQTDLHALNGQLIGGDAFFQIVQNNFRVLGITVLLSLFYGIGAVHVMVWNSALVATSMGNFFVEYLGHPAQGMLFSITRYFAHGLPEIAAYVVAGLAGSILSIAIMKHQFRSKEWWCVMKSSAQLFGIAAGLIIVAGLIEVFITPWLY